MTLVIVQTEPRDTVNERLNPIKLHVSVGADETLLLFYPRLSKVWSPTGDPIDDTVALQIAELVNKGAKKGQLNPAGYWEVMDSGDYLATYNRLQSRLTV